MAFVSLPGGLLIPDFRVHTSFNPGYSSMLLDAAGEKAGAVIRAPKTGSIRKVLFHTGAVTTAVDTDVRLETVSATDGFPTGTLLGATTNVTVLAASIVANTLITTGALTADAAVTRSDLFAVVIVPTGTPNYNVVRVATSGAMTPYSVHNSGAWAKSAEGPAMGLEYSDGSYAPIYGCWPFAGAQTADFKVSFNSGSTPDERGLKFKFRAPVKISGALVWLRTIADVRVKLYDSDGSTVLENVLLDTDQTASAANPGPVWVPFTAERTLTKDAFYRITVVPDTVTNVDLAHFDAPSAAGMDSFLGGQDFHYTERTDAGAWTDTTTKRPFIGLMVTAIDDAVAAASGVTAAPATTGGVW